MRIYSYKIIKGEIIFNNFEDIQKINELIKEWNNVVLQYANMYAKLEKFINIQTKLPKNLQKNCKRIC
jgi:hypothetical protein